VRSCRGDAARDEEPEKEAPGVPHEEARPGLRGEADERVGLSPHRSDCEEEGGGGKDGENAAVGNRRCVVGREKEAGARGDGRGVDSLPLRWRRQEVEELAQRDAGRRRRRRRRRRRPPKIFLEGKSGRGRPGVEEGGGGAEEGRGEAAARAVCHRSAGKLVRREPGVSGQGLHVDARRVEEARERGGTG
jgi:hypothetical protein